MNVVYNVIFLLYENQPNSTRGSYILHNMNYDLKTAEWSLLLLTNGHVIRFYIYFRIHETPEMFCIEMIPSALECYRNQ